MEKEIIYIQDVPLFYFEYCLKHTKDKEVKKELKEMIKQFRKRRK